MADITPGYVWQSSDTVTPARLNAAVDDAVVELTAGEVVESKIAAGAVSTGKLADLAVATGKLADAAVTAGKLGAAAVVTAALDDAAVTAGKLAGTLDLSGKTLTMPPGFWVAQAPAGAVLQTQRTTYADSTALTSLISVNDAIPQVTDGAQILTLAITPVVSTSIIRAVFTGWAGSSSTKLIVAALFRSGSNDALAVTMAYSDGGNKTTQLVLDFAHAPGAGETTYSVRVGMESSGGSFRLNGGASAGMRYFGGAAAATLTLQEIKA